MLSRVAPASGLGIFRRQIGGQDVTTLGGEIGGKRLAPNAKAHAGMAGRQQSTFPKGLADENVFPNLAVIGGAKAEATAPIRKVGLLETLLPAAGGEQHGARLGLGRRLGGPAHPEIVRGQTYLAQQKAVFAG